MFYDLPWAFKLAFFCLVCFPVVCILATGIWSVICEILGNWWGGGNYIYPTEKDKYYNKGVSQQTASHTGVGTGAVKKAKPTATNWLNKPIKQAPRAVFFGRFNGENVRCEGEYEDKWLEKWEKRVWKRNKGTTLMSETEVGRKTAKIIEKTPITETNSDDDPLMAGNGVRNPHLSTFMSNLGNSTTKMPLKGKESTVVVFWEDKRNGWYLDSNILLSQKDLVSEVHTQGHKIGEITRSKATELRRAFMAWEK